MDPVPLDIVLPEMAGSEIYRALTAVDPNVLVLLASGYSEKNQAKELQVQGCGGFIWKPFGMGELSRKICEVLEPPVQQECQAGSVLPLGDGDGSGLRDADRENRKPLYNLLICVHNFLILERLQC